MDLPFLDKPWSLAKIRQLVWGLPVPDEHTSDGYRDIRNLSWYQQRCQSYDQGDPVGVLECIQFEERIASVEDIQQRAAVTLACLGWEPQDIGAALRSAKTGRQLVEQGIRSIARMSHA